MACPQETNVEEKRNEKRTKYRQLAFELRERRVGYNIVVVPLVIDALGGGVKETIQQIERIFGKGDWGKRIVGEMQKTVLMDGESIIREMLSGLVQTETDQNVLGYVIYIRVGPHGGRSSNNEKLSP